MMNETVPVLVERLLAFADADFAKPKDDSPPMIDMASAMRVAAEILDRRVVDGMLQSWAA